MDILTFLSIIIVAIIILFIIVGYTGCKYNYTELKKENEELKEKLKKRGKNK